MFSNGLDTKVEWKKELGLKFGEDPRINLSHFGGHGIVLDEMPGYKQFEIHIHLRRTGFSVRAYFPNEQDKNVSVSCLDTIIDVQRVVGAIIEERLGE